MKSHSLSENQSHEYFYISPEKISNNCVLFGSNESRHIVRVLRHKRGDQICASDGQGLFYVLRITSDDPRLVEAEILNCEKTDQLINLILSVGILKGKRMDYVIEKSTELGVSRIIPMLTKNTVVKYLGGLRRIRLERIAMAAMIPRSTHFIRLFCFLFFTLRPPLEFAVQSKEDSRSTGMGQAHP